MEYKPYLQVGEKKLSLEDLYCLLIDRTVMPEEVTAEMLEDAGLGMGPTLCIDTEIGAIQAFCHCASVGTQLQPYQDGARPIRLTEAECMHGSDSPLETFLFGRGDSYAARMSVDIRPDDQIGIGELLQSDITVRGDPTCVSKVNFENKYTSM